MPDRLIVDDLGLALANPLVLCLSGVAAGAGVLTWSLARGLRDTSSTSGFLGSMAGIVMILGAAFYALMQTQSAYCSSDQQLLTRLGRIVYCR